MAQHRGRQGEWPRVREEEQTRDARFLAPDGFQNNDRSLVGPLRHGTAPGVGPRGPAVIADYNNSTDFGMDRIARDRRIDRKFPSDLIARELRGPGPASRQPIDSEGPTKPK